MMVSAPSSPKRSEDKENYPSIYPKFNPISSNSRSRRESLAPSKSILKFNSLHGNVVGDDNHTVAIMQVPLKDETFTKKKTIKRRVSFAPEVTLHKIDLIPQYQDSESKKPRRRQTIAVIPSSDHASSASSEVSDSDDGGREVLDDSSDIDEDDHNNITISGPLDINNYGPNFVIHDDNALGSDDDEELEESDDVSMEITKTFQQSIAPPQIFAGVQEFFQQNIKLSFTHRNEMIQLSSEDDQENEDDEVEMELTTNIGTQKILSQSTQISAERKHPHVNLEMENSQSDNNEAEMTMEFTRNIGKQVESIAVENTNSRKNQAIDSQIDVFVDTLNTDAINHQAESQDTTDQNSIMECTVEIGKIHIHEDSKLLAEQEYDEERDEPMELTQAVVSIQSQSMEREDGREDDLLMELTQAIGGIQTQSIEEEQEDLPMELTQAIGTIQAYNDVEQNNEGIEDTPMELTQTVGTIKSHDMGRDISPSKRRQEEQGDDDDEEEMTMELTQIANDSTSGERVHKGDTRKSASRQGSRSPQKANTAQTPLKQRRSKSPRSIRPSASKYLEDGSPVDRSARKRRLSMSGSYSRENTPIKSPKVNLIDKIQSLTPRRVAANRKSTISEEFENQYKAPHISSVVDLVHSFTPLRQAKERSVTPIVENHDHMIAGDNVSISHEDINDYNQASVVRPHSITTKIPLNANADTSQESIDDYVPISLKDFMDAIHIKFYDDLQIRDKPKRRSLTLKNQEFTLNDYIRSNTLLPNLELFDFSCRELRKNITDGKLLFEKLEIETQEENPPLVREYFEAAPAVRLNMNSEFQIIKDYARHQAKAVWYGWRTQLIEGLLVEVKKSFELLSEDKRTLDMKLGMINDLRRAVTIRHKELKGKFDILVNTKNQTAFFDKGHLSKLKNELIAIRESFRYAEKELSVNNDKSIDINEKLKVQNEKIQQLTAAITENENLLKMNRNFEMVEIESLKYRFEILQSSSNLKYINLIGKSLELSLDESVHINMNLSDVTKIDNIDYQFPRKFTSEVMSFFAPKLKSLVVKDNIIDHLSEFCSLWYKLRSFERDFYKLGLKFPIKIIKSDDVNTLSISLRYFSPLSKVKVFVMISFQPEMIMAYPNITFDESFVSAQSRSNLQELNGESLVKLLKEKCCNNQLLQNLGSIKLTSG